jgi:hypothetical protein
MKILARSKGGRFLSKAFKTTADMHKWECELGHKWEARPADISRGQWCPQCSSNRSERLCRATFEAIFDAEFPRKKPEWLMNSRGNRMELDGYCEVLNLAFEYHGEQHFQRVKRFQKSGSDFRQRLVDDEDKRKLCEENGVTLIEVPYTVMPEEMREFIWKQCRSIGVNVPKGWRGKNLNLATAYSPKVLEELRAIAAKKGGRCLSDHYVNSQTLLDWECSEGHRWKALSGNVRRGHWCAECAGRGAKTIEDMQRFAKNRGGRCLSKEYVNSHSNLKWECEKGHQWFATPTSIQSGKWCHECGGSARKTIAEMQQLAAERNGRCLSSKYVNTHTALEWECERGHRWMARPNNIKMGKWCPVCAGTKRLSLEEAQTSAEKMGGYCLSKQYENVHALMDWKCSSGHFWSAPYKSIRGGAWCPECRKSKQLTIKDMQKTAAGRGGLCVSKSYINSQSKLLWQCALGHRWRARPNSIRRGSWCPECHKLGRRAKRK